MKKILLTLIFFLLLINSYSEDATNDNKAKNDNANVQQIQQNTAKNGWELYSDGKYVESIKALLEERKNFPDRINVYVILAWDYGNLKDYQAMEKISQDGLSISPDDLRIIKNLFEAYFYQNKSTESIPLLEKYIAQRYNFNDPYLSTVYYYLGVSYFNLGSYRKADISLTTSMHYNPNDINTILQLANTMIKLGQLDKAKNFYNSALKIQPNNETAQDGIKKLESNQK